jgi:cytochrome c-type biogenesis protein CcmH/NrfF
VNRSRWLTWAAVGLVVMAVFLAAVVLLRPATLPRPAEQARAIAAELRCPDCAGLSAADSPTQAAAEIRRQIDEQLAAGLDADAIKASFVARYGDWILLTPPGALPWLVPLVATGLGGAVLGWWLLGRRPAPGPDEPVPTGQPAADAAPDAAPMSRQSARRLVAGVAMILVVSVVVGLALPEPYGLAAETVVNQPLAEAQAAEAARQAEIERLLQVVGADPSDTAALSDLADAYQAGTSAEDLQRAALVLLALSGILPEDPDPLSRLITAYIRADDWTDAASATDALADLAPDSPDVPFFRGLIAWRGNGDAAEAVQQFDAFLDAAPDDPRVAMIRALRQEAAASLE